MVRSDTQPTEASLPGRNPAGPPPSGAAGVTREAYEALQQEPMDLCQQILNLRQLVEAGPAALPLHSALVQRQAPGEAGPPGPIVATPTPLLRGDPNSLLSTGLDTARWPSSFKTPNVTPFKGCTDPLEFLWVYEMDIEATRGDDTTKAKSITLVLRGVALTWFFTIPHSPYTHGSSC